MPDTKILEVSWTTLWRILLFALFVTIMYLGRQILLGLFLAIIISSGLEVVVDFLERHGISRALGVILIFLMSLFLIIIVLYAVVPLVIVDLNSIFKGLPKPGPNNLFGILVNLKASQSIDALVSKLSAQLFSGNSSPLDIFSSTLGGVGLAMAVLVSSFYLSLHRDGVERFIRVVFPADYEKMTLKIYERSRKKIGSWFRTQILLSVAMGISVWIALAILGVKHAFLIGIIAAIFEIVPFVGPILSGAVAVISAFTISATLALYTLVVFLAIQQLESHVLVPLLTRRSVGLHPVIVIISILIGAEIGGFLGILIAVPAAAIFDEILEEWSSKKRAITETFPV